MPYRKPSTPSGAAGLAAVLLLALAVLTAPAAVGQDAALPGLKGGELREADLERGAFIVVVWTSWSPQCRDIVTRVNDLQDRWGQKARVLTINLQEDREEVEAFLAGKSLKSPVYLDADGAFSKKHAVTRLPGLIVFLDGGIPYRGQLPRDPDKVLGDALGE